MAADVIPEITIATLSQWLQEKVVLLIDVREQNEWDQDHLGEAILMPMSTFDPLKVPAAGELHTVIMCRSGRRSAEITRIMQMVGRKDVYNLEGGILAWRDAGLPTVAFPQA